MKEERLAAKALDAIEAEWWREATSSELASLSPFSFDAGVSTERLAASKLLRESRVPEVRQRIALRHRLGLAHVDCTNPPRSMFEHVWPMNEHGGYDRPSDCTCLTTALDELAGSPRWRVLRRAGKHHRAWLKRYPLRAPREPTPIERAPAVAPPSESALLALPPGPTPPPPPHPPQERRIWRQRGEREDPPHPLSPAAWRAQRNGDHGGDWLDREF